ncbi:MAG: hypothetical protein FJY07_07985 [Bacteroidetes bacterium]|nr:hypothetical protein [Bacteroidota bacterium]
MEEIIKTTLLEFDKSTFLIDLVIHDSGRPFIKILQTIQTGKNSSEQHEIKINPSVASEIIEVITNYVRQIGNQGTTTGQFLSDEKKNSIQDRYLKGVPLNDLALQFNLSANIIQQVLENRNIEIVPVKPPVKKRFYKRKK